MVDEYQCTVPAEAVADKEATPLPQMASSFVDVIVGISFTVITPETVLVTSEQEFFTTT